MVATVPTRVVALFWVFALVMLAFGAACTASSDYMREARAPDALRVTPDAAVVVFVRPSGYARAQRTTIMDERGRFLGDSLPEAYFAVRVAPGDHVFIGWAENTAALRASLAPGRTYYVEVAPKMGMMSARVQLLAITPRSESWKEVKTWLAESKQFVPDEAGGQAYLHGRADDVAERLRRANEILREYDAKELEERTIRAEDGT